MFEHILLLSGQFTLAVENIELNEDRFVMLVKLVVGEFNKYCPLVKKVNIIANDKWYEFIEGFPIGGQTFGIPDWVSDVKPVRILGVFPYYLNSLSPTGDMRVTRNPEIDNKTQYPWEYRSPRLYLPIAGTYDIEAVYKHKVISTVADSGLVSYEVTTISISDDEFFRLLLGHFLIALGRNRRAFTLGELPIQSDADTLASEGADVLQQAREAMADESLFYLAWS